MPLSPEVQLSFVTEPDPSLGGGTQVQSSIRCCVPTPLGALVSLLRFPSPFSCFLLWCLLVSICPQRDSPHRQPLCLSLETAGPLPCPRVPGSHLPLSQHLTCLLRLSHPCGIIILRKPGCCLSSALWRSEHSLPLVYLITLPPLLAYCQGNWNQTLTHNEINVLKTSVHLRVELRLLFFDNPFNSFGATVNRQLCIL